MISLVLLVAIAVLFLSEVASDTAIASLIMPIMAATSVSLNINPIYLMLTACLVTSLGFMLPVAPPPNVIAFWSGYITQKDLLKAGFVVDFIGIFLIVVSMYTLILWLFFFITVQEQ
jgi:sodium-dependent dicarboxylate transporter 2/3/5